MSNLPYRYRTKVVDGGWSVMYARPPSVTDVQEQEGVEDSPAIYEQAVGWEIRLEREDKVMHTKVEGKSPAPDCCEADLMLLQCEPLPVVHWHLTPEQF